MSREEPEPGNPLERGAQAREGAPAFKSHSSFRLEMAHGLAAQLDPVRFGVRAVYLLGSTKNATAGPASDIDLLVHFQGSSSQLEDLKLWLEGWSLALDEVNYRMTGYRTGGLLDLHVVTDEDIARKTSFAVKIGAASDPARLLPMKSTPQSGPEDGSRPEAGTLR
ncbi:MAG: nucleotidyltransferase domain-containing protein [Planctomycetota bacterium]